MTQPHAATAAERDLEELLRRRDLAWATNAFPIADAAFKAALLSARRQNEKDKARWDWYEENATKYGVHLSCWDVGGERNNGWTVGLGEEDNLGKGVDARMAIDDAMRHPERLRAALAATQEPR